MESYLHTTTCICGAVFNEAQQQLYLLQSLLNMHLPRPEVTDKLRNASYFVTKYPFPSKMLYQSFLHVQSDTYTSRKGESLDW